MIGNENYYQENLVTLMISKNLVAQSLKLNASDNYMSWKLRDFKNRTSLD